MMAPGRFLRSRRLPPPRKASGLFPRTNSVRTNSVRTNSVRTNSVRTNSVRTNSVRTNSVAPL